MARGWTTLLCLYRQLFPRPRLAPYREHTMSHHNGPLLRDIVYFCPTFTEIERRW